MTPREVLIRRDTCSPLWAITCATPCTPTGCRAEAGHSGICWLGSSLTREGAQVLAETLGYAVKETA